MDTLKKKKSIRKGLVFFLFLAAGFLAYDRLLVPCRNAQDCNYRCYEALKQGQNIKAKNLCSLAIKKDPDFTWPYNNRATAKNNLHEHISAIEDADKAVSLDFAYANAYNTKGIAKYTMGDNDGALADYEQAVKYNPGHEALLNIGVVKNEIKDFDGAIAAYEKAAEKHIAAAYEGIGASKRNKGDYLGALLAFTNGLEKNPNSRFALTNRARIYMIFGDFDAACEDYKKTSNGWCGYIKNIESYIKSKQKEIAENEKKGLPLATPYFELGLVYFNNLNDYKGAVGLYDKAISITPSYKFYNERGWTKTLIGDYKGALEDADAAISLAPEDVNIGYIYDTKAVALRGLGLYAEALNAHDKALSLDVKHSELFLNRAQTKGAAGDYEGAEEDLKISKGYIGITKNENIFDYFKNFFDDGKKFRDR
ncbi:Putativeley involved in type II secretion system [Elusimicrobium minutum Pei191]|uniref:Putativeley involved in type II secretion system n=1 Tax=Elusimicrobium minutum (strain Pei191) TaxID=445932 RepID=B2KBE2_ELUMP|nr:tetratricopeptide repeat protein [Elusimicrobium minutum]ACC97964.1 Putativeley involved in type II secretion system [Elusimicrobium minutum Pei191]